MMTVDSEYARSMIANHLPQKVRWLVRGTPMDFDFSRAQHPLKTVKRSDIYFDVNKEWAALWLLGERNFSEGGGACPFICMHRDSGHIYGLDVERDDQSVIFFFNSDVDKFVETFKIFDGALRLSKVDIECIPDTALKIDPQGFGRSEWRELAALLNNDD